MMEMKGHATALGVGAEPRPGPWCTQPAPSLAHEHKTMGQARPWASRA